MTTHREHTTAALTAGADASSALPYPVPRPTAAERKRRLERLWRTAGAIAYLESDRDAFRDLLEACGLLTYEPGDSGKSRPEQSPVIRYPVAGQ